jgi:hypothetical protein
MTTRPSTIRDRASAAMNDTVVVAALLATALEAIDVGLAGWPTSTPGANPETDPVTRIDLEHGPDVKLTAVERFATQRDPARADLEALDEHVRLLVHHARGAAVIVARWAQPRLDATTVGQRLAAVDAGIWCTNHIKHGMREPRREGGTECSFCAGFKSDYKRTAPFEVLDHRARFGRIYEAQVLRILAKIDEQARTRKRLKQHEQAR